MKALPPRRALPSTATITMRTFIRRHALPSYFALTFAVSWGCIVLAVWADTGGLSPTPAQFQATVPVAVPAMLLGPALASLTLTGVVAGRAGYRELWSRLRTWRVGGRWYAFALLVAPATMGVVVLSLWAVAPAYAPRIATSGNALGVVAMATVLGLVVGFFEEVGWTGFAIPRSLERLSVLGAGVLVGVLWGAWHFFVAYWGGSGTNGGIPLAVFLSLWVAGLVVGQLTAYRVLMVWVYARTGSLSLVMLMHASLAGFQFMLNPLTPGWPQQVFGAGYALTAWMVVAILAATRRAGLTRPPAHIVPPGPGVRVAAEGRESAPVHGDGPYR